MARKKTKKPKPTIIPCWTPLPGQMDLSFKEQDDTMLPPCPSLSLPATPRPRDFRPYLVVS
jgi:hypothetical protein